MACPVVPVGLLAPVVQLVQLDRADQTARRKLGLSGKGQRLEHRVAQLVRPETDPEDLSVRLRRLTQSAPEETSLQDP